MSYYRRAIGRRLRDEVPEYRPLPSVSQRKNMKIEFADDFHDLMHSIFDHCENKRLHIKYWWQYKGFDTLMRHTLCKIGFHGWGWMTTFVDSAGNRYDEGISEVICGACLIPRSEVV